VHRASALRALVSATRGGAGNLSGGEGGRRSDPTQISMLVWIIVIVRRSR
jgi:hypothetical protein